MMQHSFGVVRPLQEEEVDPFMGIFSWDDPIDGPTNSMCWQVSDKKRRDSDVHDGFQDCLEFCLRNVSDVGVVKLLPHTDLLFEGLVVLRHRVLPIMPPIQDLQWCIPIQCNMSGITKV